MLKKCHHTCNQESSANTRTDTEPLQTYDTNLKDTCSEPPPLQDHHHATGFPSKPCCQATCPPQTFHRQGAKPAETTRPCLSKLSRVVMTITAVDFKRKPIHLTGCVAKPKSPILLGQQHPEPTHMISKENTGRIFYIYIYLFIYIIYCVIYSLFQALPCFPPDPWTLTTCHKHPCSSFGKWSHQNSKAHTPWVPQRPPGHGLNRVEA